MAGKAGVKRRPGFVKSNPWQSTFRLHKNDHAAFVAKLMTERMKISIQSFVEACVYAYLDDNEKIMDIINAHALTHSIKKRKDTDWSKREKDRLLDDIEEAMKEFDA